MRYIIRLIKEAVKDIPTLVYDDIHPVEDLEKLSPYEAYGLGHEAGKEHAETFDEEAAMDNSIDEFVDGSYGMRGRTVPMGVPGRK